MPYLLLISPIDESQHVMELDGSPEGFVTTGETMQ